MKYFPLLFVLMSCSYYIQNAEDSVESELLQYKLTILKLHNKYSLNYSLESSLFSDFIDKMELMNEDVEYKEDFEKFNSGGYNNTDSYGNEYLVSFIDIGNSNNGSAKLVKCIIRSFGANLTDEKGEGDDIEIEFIFPINK